MANRNSAPFRGLRVAFISPCVSCGVYVPEQDSHQHAVTGELVCTDCAIRKVAPVVAADAASLALASAALTTAAEAAAGGVQ